MIKKIIVSLSILAGALSFTSCGGGENSGGGTEAVKNEEENKNKIDLQKDYKTLFPQNALSEGRKVIDNLLIINDRVDATSFSDMDNFNQIYQRSVSTPLGDVSTKNITAASADLFKMDSQLQEKALEKFNQSINALIELNSRKGQKAMKGKSGEIGSQVGRDIRYVDAKGLEVSELVEKQIMGIVLLDQILNEHLGNHIMKNTTLKNKNTQRQKLTGKQYTELEYHWDMAYALLGGDNRNGSPAFIANYMVNEFQGAEFMKGVDKRVDNAFKVGRMALKNGEYDKVDKQIGIIREDLSKLFATRCVHYLKQSSVNLDREITSPEYQKAFHELSEAYGFLYAFVATRKANGTFYINDFATIEQLADELLSEDGFWDKNNLKGGALNHVAQKIGEIFGFNSDLVL